MFTSNNSSNANTGKTSFSNMFNNSANNNTNAPNPNNSSNTPGNIFTGNNANRPNNVFSGGNTSTNFFSNNQASTNTPGPNVVGGGGTMGNNNSAQQNKPGNIFANIANPTVPTSNTPVNPPSNSLFNRANNPPPANLFTQNNVSNQSGTPGQNTSTTTGNNGVFGGNTGGNTGGGFNNASNNNTTNMQVKPQNTTSGQAANSIPTNTSTPNTGGGTNLFKPTTNNAPQNNPGSSGTPTPANNLFANNNTNQPINTNTQQATLPTSPQNTGGTFGNKPAASTPPQTNTGGTTGTNLFANNQTGGQPGTTNLFNQGNPTAQNNPTGATGGTLGTTNLFNQGNNPPAQGNPTGGTIGTGSTGNPGNITANLTQPRDDIQTQLDKSNQTVAEFIDDLRKTFLITYQDLQKLADSAMKYLDEKEQNQRLIRNFNIMEPMIANKSEFVLRTLEGMSRQQDEIENTINLMSKRLGEGHYVHELSRHLEDYEQIKEEVMMLQQEGGDWSDPSNEQLADIFQNLNLVEMQIREMDEQVERYLHSMDSYL